MIQKKRVDEYMQDDEDVPKSVTKHGKKSYGENQVSRDHEDDEEEEEDYDEEDESVSESINHDEIAQKLHC